MILALITVAVFLVVTVALPVLSFRRASAARNEVVRLEQRLAALEDATRHGRPTRPAPASEAAGLDPSAEVAPALPGAPPTRAEEPQPAPAHFEARIGTRWLLNVGVTTLVIGVGLFIRYAFVNQWITEPLRVGTGLVTGALLIRIGRRFAAAGQVPFGHTLVGGGFATWYLSIYAALNLYGLVNAVIGFGLFVLVTVLVATQANRLRSQSLAMMAVLGGFGTPFLVGLDTTAPLTLLGYTALLIAAIVYLAKGRDWPVLNLMSFLLTGLTVTVWHTRFYRPSAYLSTELFFTLYCGLFLWVLYLMRTSSHPIARWVRPTLWTAPVWYHAASLAILADHWLALLVYLIAVTGVGLAATVHWDAMWTRVLLWAAVAAPLFGWADGQPDGSWLVPAVVTWLTIASVHVYAQLEQLKRMPARLHAADVVLVPTNGLGLYFGLQTVLELHLYTLTALVAAVLASAYGVLTVLTRRIEAHAARHVLVVAVTLAVVAVAVQFDGAWVTMLCATQAGGLVWLGIRERRDWIRVGGALLLAVSVIQLLAIQLAAVPAVYSVFLNQRATLGLFIVGVFCLVAWLHGRSYPDAVNRRRLSMATAVVAAHVVMLVTLSTEIHAFWEVREDTVRFASSADLVRQMMLSATWGAYGAGLTAAGITRRYAPIRYLALVVFGMTVLKVFIVDFSQLDSVYRIVSSIALGLLLTGASYLYQRSDGRLADAGERDEHRHSS